MVLGGRLVRDEVVGDDDEVAVVHGGLLAPHQPEHRAAPRRHHGRAAQRVDGVGARRLPGVSPHGRQPRLCARRGRLLAVPRRQDEVCPATGATVAGPGRRARPLADLAVR